jgi:hypothetical protein
VTKRTKVLVIGVVAAVLAVGVGAAVAGGGLFESQDAFVNDVAKRLDVTPEQLRAAVKGAYDDQIDAAVAAGKITKDQGEAMKQRAAQNGGLPLLGGGHGGFGHHGPGGGLAAAAAYLGVTEAELHTQLESGKTLAEIAKANGKSVDGLEAAMTAELKSKLDAAVKAGRITRAQADAMLKQMSSRLADMVNGKLGAGMHPDGDGGNGFGGPMRHGGGSFGGSGAQQGSGPFMPVPA